jgi:hypothetical protein
VLGVLVYLVYFVDFVCLVLLVYSASPFFLKNAKALRNGLLLLLLYQDNISRIVILVIPVK